MLFLPSRTMFLFWDKAFPARAERNARAMLRRSQNDLRLLTAQLLATEELASQRMARELHDGLGQALSGLKLGLEKCSSQLRAGSVEAAAETIGALTGRVQALVEEVRRISMNLRPTSLDDLGLIASLAALCRDLSSVAAGCKLECQMEVVEADIPAQAKTAIYRIVQEAFNNATTHSAARALCLTMLIEEGYLELRIRDDGVGFDVNSVTRPDARGRGLGLACMRERAEGSGGRFFIESRKGRGTTIVVRWPLPQSKAT